MISNLACGSVFAELAAHAGWARGIRWLIDGDVVFLLHALDQFFDEFVELAIRRHLLRCSRMSSSN